MAAERIVNI